MGKKTNIAPWVIFGLLAIAAFCAPFVVAQTGLPVYTRKNGSAFADQLAPNPVAGAMLTPVGTDTKQVTWTIPPNVNGTQDYVPKFGTSGVTNSHAYEGSGAMNVVGENLTVQNNGAAFIELMNASDSDGPRQTLTRQFGTTESPANVYGYVLLGLYDFRGKTAAGKPTGAYLATYSSATSSEGYLTGEMCAVLANGTSANATVGSWCANPNLYTIYTPLQLSGLINKSAGKVLYDTDGAGTVGEKTLAISDVTGLQTSLDVKAQLGTSPASDVMASPGVAGTATSAARENHQHRLGSNYPAPGMLPFATGTGTASGTGNSITWRQAQESDIAGLATDLASKEPLSSGTPGKAVCFSGTGTSTVTAKGACAFSTFTGGTLYAGSNVALSTGTNTTTTTSADLGSSPKIHVVGVVNGTGTLVGTTSYLPIKTAGGWGDSHEHESGGSMYVDGQNLVVQNDGASSVEVKNASDTDGPQMSFTRQFGSLGSPGNVSGYSLLGLINFDGKTASGIVKGAYISSYSSSTTSGNLNGLICSVVSDGTTANANIGSWCSYAGYFEVYTPLRLTGLTNKGAGKVLYDTDGNGNIGEKTLTAADVGLAYSTSTPASVATSGNAGTSTSVSRGDHVHADSLLTTVIGGGGAGTLSDLIMSYTGSIDVGMRGTSPVQMNLNTTFGASTPAAVGTSGSVGTANSSSRSDHVHAGSAPLAHGSTHNPGGSDVPSAFSTTPGVNKIPILAANSDLGAWIFDASASTKGLLSTAHYNLLAAASATPGAGVLAKGDASGTLNSWVSGKLVSSTKYTTNAALYSDTSSWNTRWTTTFTATGTKYRVRAYGVVAVGSSDSANPKLCGLGIVADTGSSASTVRDAAWDGSVNYNNFYDGLLSGKYVVGTVRADAVFTLSTGTVTLGLAMSTVQTSGTRCEVPSGAAYMYVDIYD